MTERHELEEIPFLLVSDLPYAPRTIRETMPLWANAFDNHVWAAGFQSNNVPGLKLVVHFQILLWFAPIAIKRINLVTISGIVGRLAARLKLRHHPKSAIDGKGPFGLA
jgi:hypothetical protein